MPTRTKRDSQGRYAGSVSTKGFDGVFSSLVGDVPVDGVEVVDDRDVGGLSRAHDSDLPVLLTDDAVLVSGDGLDSDKAGHEESPFVETDEWSTPDDRLVAPKKQGVLAKALAAAKTSGFHPILAAAQFSALTRDTGGATMNVHTGGFTTIGSEGYGVGGARADRPIREYDERTARGRKSTSNRYRIPSRTVQAPENGELALDVVQQQRSRVRRMTSSNPQSNVGSWHTGGGKVDIDASEVEPNREVAIAKGKRRKEKAIFDFKNGRDIDLR